MINQSANRFLSAILLALFASVIISGCSSTTNSNPPAATSSNVYPKTGSTYTYSTTATDSSGNATGSPTTVNESVIDSGKTYFGQSNTYTIGDDAGDTTHHAYSSSNDALIFIENSGASGILASVADTILRRWLTLSIATHTTGVVVLDSMPIAVVVSGFTVNAKVHLVVNYIGSDSLKVGSENLFVQHCQIMARATSDPNFLINPPITLIHQRDVYFAPKIGTYAKETTMTTIPPVAAAGLAGSKTGSVKVLTSYNLK